MAGEQAFDVDGAIAALEAQKTGIEETIAALRRYQALGIRGAVAAETRSVDPSNIPDDAFFGLSIGEAAKKYLGIVKKKQSIREIAEALDRGGLHHASGDFVATVATMLRRHAAKDFELVRVGRGDWGLAAWYGNRRPTAKPGPSGKAKGRKKRRVMAHEKKDEPAIVPVGDMAAAVLGEQGKPLSVDEITALMERNFGKLVPKPTLVSTLSRGVKTGKFTRPGPSVYGLVG
jgi:hypothetical protein